MSVSTLITELQRNIYLLRYTAVPGGLPVFQARATELGLSHTTDKYWDLLDQDYANFLKYYYPDNDRQTNPPSTYREARPFCSSLLLEKLGLPKSAVYLTQGQDPACWWAKHAHHHNLRLAIGQLLEADKHLAADKQQLSSVMARNKYCCVAFRDIREQHDSDVDYSSGDAKPDKPAYNNIYQAWCAINNPSYSY